MLGIGQDEQYDEDIYKEDLEVEKLLDKLTPGPGQYIG